MRIEKLDENKLRILITNQELKEKNIDFHTFMSNPIESQSVFGEILKKAENELGFTTKNYQIHIEAILINYSDFIITITRELPTTADIATKKIYIKRKKIKKESTQAIYIFNCFDDFCSFSEYIISNNINITKLAKSLTLYYYNNQYYFIINDINLNFQGTGFFLASISEFGLFNSSSKMIKSKIIESGKLIFKNNALETCNKFFSNQKTESLN